MGYQSGWRVRAVGLAAVMLLAGAVGVADAGPLNPPGGPVMSTPGPEPRVAINAVNSPGDADSLFKITQPGSYYLTGNITGVVGKHGIEIAASGVTLDLNGFEVVGSVGSLDGIATEGTRSSTVIRHGVVRGWGSDGINLITGGVGGETLIDGIIASSNASFGVRVGDNAIVRNSHFRSNGGTGLGGTANLTAVDCSAVGNAGTGLSGSTASVIRGCVSRMNTGVGIVAGSNSTISGCAVRDNGSTGIVASVGCVVTECSVGFSTGDGINVGLSSSVISCTSESNRLDGIECAGRGLILNNTCSDNGNGGDGANILVFGNDTRVEGNNCLRADRGIDVDFLGNVIVRNTCSGNTVNYSIVANNVCGPIVDRTAPGSAAISGNSAASSMGSTDPWANFAY